MYFGTRHLSFYNMLEKDGAGNPIQQKQDNQNYVPVVDDQGYFIGIITRKEIIKYCYKELKKYVAASNAEKTESQIDSPEN